MSDPKKTPRLPGSRLRPVKQPQKPVFPDRLELPTGLLGKTPYLTLRGQEELELFGCADLRRYETDCIEMRLSSGCCLTIRGKELCLRAYQRCRLTVCGRIDGLEFTP